VCNASVEERIREKGGGNRVTCWLFVGLGGGGWGLWSAGGGVRRLNGGGLHLTETPRCPTGSRKCNKGGNQGRTTELEGKGLSGGSRERNPAVGR